MNKKINIAIDGYASSGKSTLAKAIAKELDYLYIDSGAMYRAVTFYAITNNLHPVHDKQRLIDHLPNIKIDLFYKRGRLIVELNKEDVSNQIRSLSVSSLVSEVAVIKEIREKMVSLQKAFGKDKGVVMDGRDIGSVVFPDAEIKFFVNANIEARSYRRLQELKSKGDSKLSVEKVLQNLEHRDKIDSTRDTSPLVQTSDAIVLDNSNVSFDEFLNSAMKYIKDYLD